MPHQCIKCSLSYPDSSLEVLQGCSCGSKAFYFIRELDSSNPSDIVLVDNSSDTDCDLIDVDELLHKKEVIFSSEEGKYTVNVEAILSGQRPKL